MLSGWIHGWMNVPAVGCPSVHLICCVTGGAEDGGRGWRWVDGGDDEDPVTSTDLL